MGWTADELIAKVRTRARIPDGSSVMSDSELLLLADEVIADTMLPLVRSAAEEYGVAQTDVTITAGTASYRIPTRSQAQGLRDVILLKTSTGTGISLPRVPLEEIEHYASSGSVHWRGGAAFALQGDRVVILPTPSQADFSIRFRYYRRPSKLVLAAAAAKVTAINSPDDGDYTTTTVPAAWDTDELYDLIEGNPGFDWLAVDDDNAAQTSGAVMQFATIPSTEIAVGDYSALAGETPIPQIPAELHPILVRSMVYEIHAALGDKTAAAAASVALSRRMAHVRNLLNPRVDGEATKIVNRRGHLRGRRWVRS